MNIYQQIWNADQEGNGIKPVSSIEEHDPDHGYVVVNEKVNENGDHKLFPKVHIPNQKQETYDLCRNLFNNYALDKRRRETKTPEEDQEVYDLLDVIVYSKPMKAARQFVAEQTGETYSQSRWIKKLIDIWFTQFDMGQGRDLSAFEHIVVGEQSKGKVSGYHFWYKYYLDDSMEFLNSDDIVYVAPRYEGPRARYGALTSEGIQTPEISTIAYKWDAYDYDTGARRPLYKPVGGFWNGCSIEGLLALGTIRFLREARAPKECIINGASYELKLFRSDDNRHLRTFYPKFLGRLSAPEPIPEPVPDPVPPPIPSEPEDVDSEIDVRVVAALVNPKGDDEGYETVTLLNVSPEDVDVSRWSIRDKNGNVFRCEALTIPSGETRVVPLPKNTAQLSNRGGTVELLDQDGKKIHGVSYSRAQAKRKGWTVVF